ncbi:MAG: GAF domain-containing sensor histidine kinase [Coleofasciculus sp. C3-bin4]|nr:GAF domain-containing sensor histidine kinase [Coleofasciculus sp. C3-bin4]
MFIPASSEFVALCKSQVAVLTQGLGAALSAVYLTQELVEGAEAKLIPVVVYPEATVVWEEDDTDLVLPEQMGKIVTIPRLLRSPPRLLPQASDNDQEVDSTSADWEENFLRQQRQIVLPLMYEGVVMGLLVTGREDRPWNEREKATIERIARSLAIAYLMDQRRAWFEQQLTQQRRLQAQQRDMLDDLLHQFRNPLTALRTFGKLLLKRLRPGDKNQEVASSIVRESDRLQELLQQFDAALDSSEGDIVFPLTLTAAPVAEACQLPTRGDHGGSPTANSLLPGKALTLETFSVAAVLEPLLVSARAIAQERNLELQAEIPTDLPLVQGNANALREVLSNLIDNALKYTPAGGKIDIRVGEKRRTSQGEALGIAITDTGPGIPPQDLEHLFERHYRGVQASTAIPGSGLGLAIAKELIEQMHGEIQVFSPAQPVWAKQKSESAIGNVQDNPARGTTFIVWLLMANG